MSVNPIKSSTLPKIETLLAVRKYGLPNRHGKLTENLVNVQGRFSIVFSKMTLEITGINNIFIKPLIGVSKNNCGIHEIIFFSLFFFIYIEKLHAKQQRLD